MIESHGITIIKTNPDAANFNKYTLYTKYTCILLNQLKSKPKYQQKNH